MIRIYKGKKYLFLHPYYSYKVKYKGIDYCCIWVALLSQKFKEQEIKEEFSNFTLEEAIINDKKYERLKTYNQKEWDKEKYKIMENLYKYRLYTDDIAMQKLLDTKTQDIEFCLNPNEYFWGVYEEQGENNIGRILMSIRDEKFHKNKLENIKNNKGAIYK